MDEEKLAIGKMYEPYLTETPVNPKLSFTMEELDALSEFNADLIPYVQERLATWIMKGGIEKEWESYLKQLKKIGADKYQAIYQAAYDRYRQD